VTIPFWFENFPGTHALHTESKLLSGEAVLLYRPAAQAMQSETSSELYLPIAQGAQSASFFAASFS
jgi:hypothetical protein